jgi:ParB family transcriptional regulator, chromosome partitioning protein
LARPDFRNAAAQRLSEERELSPAIISLLSPEGSTRSGAVRQVPVARIDPSPDQPRLALDKDSLNDLAASVREHGVLQPILVRPLSGGRYQLVAGERRWRASIIAGLETIPAMVEDLDEATALEISIIENLQREDLSPLEEATMYQRMTSERGYSVRKLAQKLGKDKGYVENRLRLADAPAEIRELVSLRKDTLSHAYELLKVADPRRRRKLAEQVARGELSLAKLRAKIEGRGVAPVEEGVGPEPRRRTRVGAEPAYATPTASQLGDIDREEADEGAAEVETAARADATPREVPVGDDALLGAKNRLNEALGDLVAVLRAGADTADLSDTDRSNLAKYLTIAKLRLENAIALLRAGEARDRR